MNIGCATRQGTVEALGCPVGFFLKWSDAVRGKSVDISVFYAKSLAGVKKFCRAAVFFPRVFRFLPRIRCFLPHGCFLDRSLFSLSNSLIKREKYREKRAVTQIFTHTELECTLKKHPRNKLRFSLFPWKPVDTVYYVIHVVIVFLRAFHAPRLALPLVPPHPRIFTLWSLFR